VIDKDESRRIHTQIRHLLLNVWDPIGIRNEPKAQDEYDGYIGRLYELLVSRVPDTELIDYLHWVAHDRMGFDAATKSDMVETVGALRKILLPTVSN
jgi:hypothetical protein